MLNFNPLLTDIWLERPTTVVCARPLGANSFMETKIELTYPRNNISTSEILDSICSLMPEFGANFDRRTNSILMWYDAKARFIRKNPYDFFVTFDSKIIAIENQNKIKFVCTRAFPLWLFYVPMIIPILSLPVFFFDVTSGDTFIRTFLIGFVIISIFFSILNYYVFAPYWFKLGMRKLIDKAMEKTSAPNNRDAGKAAL